MIPSNRESIASETKRIIYDASKIQTFVNQLDLYISCGDDDKVIDILYALNNTADQLSSDVNYLLGEFQE